MEFLTSVALWRHVLWAGPPFSLVIAHGLCNKQLSLWFHTIRLSRSLYTMLGWKNTVLNLSWSRLHWCYHILNFALISLQHWVQWPSLVGRSGQHSLSLRGSDPAVTVKARRSHARDLSKGTSQTNSHPSSAADPPTPWHCSLTRGPGLSGILSLSLSSARLYGPQPAPPLTTLLLN